VRKVGPPPKDTGEVDRDTEKARVWLARVMVKYGAQVKRQREKAAQVDPYEESVRLPRESD
jgi:hypothetical protein